MVSRQRISHPRRYLIDLDRTTQVALAYYRTGTIDTSSPDWDNGDAWDDDH